MASFNHNLKKRLVTYTTTATLLASAQTDRLKGSTTFFISIAVTAQETKNTGEACTVHRVVPIRM